jgi:hypothetical protein
MFYGSKGHAESAAAIFTLVAHRFLRFFLQLLEHEKALESFTATCG